MSEAPQKTLTDRAYELLYLWIGTNFIGRADEELPREAVRWCRALEAEVAQETKRPEQLSARVARRAPGGEEDW